MINFRSNPGACHEAGHAVVARHLGLLIREANYYGDDGGYVDHLPCAIFDAYPAVAGYVAQLMAAGKKESFHFRMEASSDYHRISGLLSSYLDKDQLLAYQYKLEDDVAAFLQQPEIWRCVVRFGEALFCPRPLNSAECMTLTDGVPRKKLADVQQTMLSPVFHDYFGRRIGRAKLVQHEKLLNEAVAKLRPAFQSPPPLADIRRTLEYEGYANAEAEQLMADVYDFWLQS